MTAKDFRSFTSVIGNFTQMENSVIPFVFFLFRVSNKKV